MSPSTVATEPMRGAIRRATAPSASSAACNCAIDSPITPGAIKMAIFLALMLPSPGRAISDSSGETVTSGVAGWASASGMASGKLSMPRPAATFFARSSDALRSIDTVRRRMAGTVTLLSSKRKAAAICAFSTSVWLS